MDITEARDDIPLGPSRGWTSGLNEPNVGLRRRDGTGKESDDPEATTPEPLMSLKEESLRRIALHLFRLDLWSAQTVTEDMTRKSRLANIEPHFEQLWINPPPIDLIEKWLDSPELYHAHGIMNLPGFHPYVTGLSYKQLKVIVKERDEPAKAMYIRLMLGRIWKLKDRNLIHELALQDLTGSFGINLGLLIGERATDANHYISKLTQRQIETEARSFPSALPGAFHQHYPAARKLLDAEHEGTLLDPLREPWSEDEKSRQALRKPTPAPSSSALLAMISFTCSLCAFVPAMMGYINTANGPGSWNDNSFWGLLAGVILQILGLGAQILGPLAFPGSLQTRLQQETQVLVWIFAALTSICTVASVILYVTVSAPWSGFCAFAGQAMMGFVQLMLVFGAG
ncbi:hypothetical protein CONLIGDRAFT_675643 [Coniochaeta ligniaria NRRL 30616]|uniref:Uncharacterized protein n=1 Tax=Coniochaeta ligniaria NRRL 30616 TaxID=1408157 RepID=A0A1J7J4G8_9PEZI|nr:hypothetical protein CONLIGDRAFT_675643 [Coniochaeta ligniaria NRRL 30616]